MIDSNAVIIFPMDQKLKILFVCTVNRMRSATAQVVFKADPRFEVRSAGTDKNANVVLSEELLNWANVIVVMEKHHRNFIRGKFSGIYDSKRIVCLYIQDDYEFMQPELIAILKDRVESAYNKGLLS